MPPGFVFRPVAATDRKLAAIHFQFFHIARRHRQQSGFQQTQYLRRGITLRRQGQRRAYEDRQRVVAHRLPPIREIRNLVALKRAAQALRIRVMMPQQNNDIAVTVPLFPHKPLDFGRHGRGLFVTIRRFGDAQAGDGGIACFAVGHFFRRQTQL